MENQESPVAIRTVTKPDVAAVREIARQTWRSTYAGKIPDQQITEFLGSAYSLASLERTCDGLGDGFLVAESDQTPIGYAMSGKNREGMGELYALYVLPKRQQRGVGWRLWNRSRAHLQQLGCSELILWVLDSNVQARRFYERQGASAWSERDFPVGSGNVREVGYRASLSP